MPVRLVLALLPLLAFYAVESWAGLRPALVAAIGLALVELGVGRWRDGRFNRMSLIGVGLIGGLGGLSLASNDPRFALWTPAVGGLVFAAVLLGGLLLPESLLEVAVREQDPSTPLDPWARHTLRAVTGRLAGALVLHAGLCAWAVGQPRETWLLVTGPGQFAVLGALIAGELAWARLRPT